MLNDKFIIYHLTIMRKPVPPEKKNKAFGISFPPALKEAARKRAFELEISLSAYLQSLVTKDLGSHKRATNSKLKGGCHHS